MSRHGCATLQALGDSAPWAEREEDYVRLAAGLARQAADAPAMRQAMHERMRRSMILDERGYVARVEEAYRDMWHRWCRTVSQ